MNATRGTLKLAVIAVLVLIAARPAQAQTETVLWNFNGLPYSSLIFDHAGNLYGATWSGGAFGLGSVYELSPNGSGGWNETVLYSFCSAPNCADGARPGGPLVFDSAGNLYGITTFGGNNDCGGQEACGVVFELSPVGGSWTETVLYSFCPDGNCADGWWPEGGVIVDPAGNLYGDSSLGAFELSPSGGGWTYQIIYSSGGVYTMDAAGNLFGGAGSAVIELSPNGSGGWNPTTIYTFSSGGDGPHGSPGTLVVGQAGNLYGTTDSGGGFKVGTAFRLSPGANGWTEQTLYSFRPADKNGYPPYGGIVLDAAGNIYGTTGEGGEYGAGTVFELVAPTGKRAYTEKILWSFNGSSEGYYPTTGVILDSAGNLYGTTEYGGDQGGGVAYEVTGVPVTTTTTLTSSPNPSTYGEAVTFTAALTSLYGALPPNGETVSFMQGKTLLGTGTLTGGSASFSISTLNVGTASVSATYGGDTSFLGSTSNTVKQKVKKAAN
jgi:uncharacterized repeat protein (TIGR03803 family)